MHRYFGFFVAVALLLGPPVQAQQGWAVFASGGNIYRSSVGDTPERLYSGGVAHATWSADGLYIFFIKSNGEIWRMYNDGTSASRIAYGQNTAYNPLGVYRPDRDDVIYVEDSTFFCIDGNSGAKTVLHQGTRNYVGEVAINTAGTRLAARGVNSSLYTIDVGGASNAYSTDCSSSVSPNGSLVTANVSGHQSLTIHNWSGSVFTTLHAPSGKKWDNQKFAANSNDYVVFKYDNETAIGVVRVATDVVTRICEMGSDYPDFFVGGLPDPPSANAPPTASISAPGSGAVYRPGEVIHYSGSGSDPEDGTLTGGSLRWELDLVNDGSGPIHTSTGGSGNYTFPVSITEATEYLLRLTVEDSAGSVDSASISLWVTPESSNQQPVVSLVAADPNPANVGVVVTFICTASDPDSDPLTYSWNFGDGHLGTGAQVGHSFETAGGYLVEVEVSDGQNDTVVVDLEVNIVESNTIVIEAEDMTLGGDYQIEGNYIATMTTGSAVEHFPAAGGAYRVQVVIIRESDGQPTVDVAIGGTTIATINYELGASSRDPQTVDIGVHPIEHNEEIALYGTRVDGAAARVDRLIFQTAVLANDAGAVSDDGVLDAVVADVNRVDTPLVDRVVSDTVQGDRVIAEIRPDTTADDEVVAGQDTIVANRPVSDDGDTAQAGDGCACSGTQPKQSWLPIFLIPLLLQWRRWSFAPFGCKPPMWAGSTSVASIRNRV